MNRTAQPRSTERVEPPANGEPVFTLTFTKAEADALASCLDVTLKAAGLPAAQSVNLWMQKIQHGMKEEPC